MAEGGRASCPLALSPTGSGGDPTSAARPQQCTVRRTQMRIRPRVWTLLAASTLLAAACGGNGDESGGGQATTPPQPAKVTVTATASGQQIKFEVPAQIRPGATELTLVNNLKEPAEFQLVRLDAG